MHGLLPFAEDLGYFKHIIIALFQFELYFSEEEGTLFFDVSDLFLEERLQRFASLLDFENGILVLGLDTSQLDVKLSLHILLLCIKDLDKLILHVLDCLLLSLQSLGQVFLDLLCELPQSGIVRVNLLLELVIVVLDALIKSILPFSQLFPFFLVLPEDELQLIIPIIVSSMVHRTHLELFLDFSLECLESVVVLLEFFVDVL